MRIIIQRVSSADCKVNGETTGKINKGLLLFLGVENRDTQEDLDWLAKKIVNLRIFSDEQGKMNKSLLDIEGDILLISQFTLFALTKKGNRPSFIRAGAPDFAKDMYLKMSKALEKLLGKKVKRGTFGADMKINANNDGPVSLIMDTKDRDNF
ncbi:MAG TPA: D-aminoacyl-tRNA deacylase [Sphingobacterium sp.]|nr:D-aminoacyl-tRNA deacylase [Sphingobacterium sp.]